MRDVDEIKNLVDEVKNLGDEIIHFGNEIKTFGDEINLNLNRAFNGHRPKSLNERAREKAPSTQSQLKRAREKWMKKTFLLEGPL